MNHEKVLYKVWYNPHIKGYELFDREGSSVKYALGASVHIEDTWNSEKNIPATATITLLVEVVNEQPKINTNE